MVKLFRRLLGKSKSSELPEPKAETSAGGGKTDEEDAKTATEEGANDDEDLAGQNADASSSPPAPPVPEMWSALDLLIDVLLDDEKSLAMIDTLFAMNLAAPQSSRARLEFCGVQNICPNLIHAMECHADVAAAQWKCCSLIATLAFKHQPNKQHFIESQAIPAIIRAMQKWPTSVKMQDCGCSALCNLSALPQYQNELMEGIKVLLDAMRDFPHHAEIQNSCCEALSKLSRYNASYRKTIVELGGGILLAEAQSNFAPMTEGNNKVHYYSACSDDDDATTLVHKAATHALKKLVGGGGSGGAEKPSL